MAKSRREQFEEQLRALQDDITHLSRRLGSPVSADPVRHATTDAAVERRVATTTKSAGKEKGENARLTKEKRLVERERDDLLFKTEQLHRENSELRQSLLDFERVKSLFEHLKQDHDSLLVSLQSSERIRRQQKELIQILQRSAIGGDLAASSTAALSLHAGDSCSDSVSGLSRIREDSFSINDDSATPLEQRMFRSTIGANHDSSLRSINLSASSKLSETGGHYVSIGRPPRVPVKASSAQKSTLSSVILQSATVQKKSRKKGSGVKLRPSSAPVLSNVSTTPTQQSTKRSSNKISHTKKK